MNHCLIITAYKDVENLNRLISKCPENWGIYVHLDKKSRLSVPDINPRAKVFRWYKVYWGAYEHILAIFRLIKFARSEADWDFYHIISGQDYFASAPAEFDDICERGKNYITVQSLPDPGWCWDCGEGIIFKYKHFSSIFDIRKRFLKHLDHSFEYIQKVLGFQCKVPEYAVFHGIVYSSLNSFFINWMLAAPITQDLLNRLRNTIVGEEVFFQTLIMNSPYRGSIADSNLHYDNWGGGEPMILCEKDYEIIVSSGTRYLFCRKIDSTCSKGLIEMLDHNIIGE